MYLEAHNTEYLHSNETGNISPQHFHHKQEFRRASLKTRPLLETATWLFTGPEPPVTSRVSQGIPNKQTWCPRHLRAAPILSTWRVSCWPNSHSLVTCSIRRLLWYRWTLILLGKAISFREPDSIFSLLQSDPNLLAKAEIKSSMWGSWLLLVKRSEMLGRIAQAVLYISAISSASCWWADLVQLRGTANTLL